MEGGLRLWDGGWGGWGGGGLLVGFKAGEVAVGARVAPTGGLGPTRFSPTGSPKLVVDALQFPADCDTQDIILSSASVCFILIF